MRLNEIAFGAVVPIDSYGPGFFRIAGHVVHGPILVRAGGAADWGGLEDIDRLAALAGEVDVLLLGTGAAMAPVPASLRAALAGPGPVPALPVEPMATPPACRTYNVLLAEGRRVAAALLPV